MFSFRLTKGNSLSFSHFFPHLPIYIWKAPKWVGQGLVFTSKKQTLWIFSPKAAMSLLKFRIKNPLPNEQDKITSYLFFVLCAGLRVRLRETVSPQEQQKRTTAKKSNIEKCREYRERMKDDPEYIEKNRQKCRAYRSRQLTEEELLARREAGRLRTKKYRYGRHVSTKWK